MKTPKYINDLIDRKAKLGMKLLSVSNELDDWLIKNEFDLSSDELKDCTLTGCMIYCEPEIAAENVRNVIKER